MTDFYKGYEGIYSGDIYSSEIIRMSRRFIKGKVLDIGAGSGALISKIPASIGIDLVSKHIRIITGNAAFLPFKNNYFDTIFANEFLEHLNDGDLGRVLREVMRVLRPKGKFIIIPCLTGKILGRIRSYAPNAA